MNRPTELVFFATLCCAAAARAELIDNPVYVSWAKHTEGTRVTMQTTASTQGITVPSSSTLTLLETTPAKVVVEVAVLMDLGGTKQEIKRKMEVPAKVERGKEHLPEETSGGTKVAGSERVSVAGKSYECKIVEYTGQMKNNKVTGRVWASEEIPGGMAKQEAKIDGPRQATVLTVVTGFVEK